eukprot:CAMPEP_0114548576 /NCGR_PEP_ID=MMETSP0114-20121206/5058_1 /TAXON_ID=31324 /ORGANISM="Goniomonas sp, Strain m" /LENGTH=223 /DNA_ID=CAMNT_0001733181 /DNA_START=239 /DNA_END=910 /DNA_ORIENTATION=+
MDLLGPADQIRRSIDYGDSIGFYLIGLFLFLMLKELLLFFWATIVLTARNPLLNVASIKRRMALWFIIVNLLVWLPAVVCEAKDCLVHRTYFSDVILGWGIAALAFGSISFFVLGSSMLVLYKRVLAAQYFEEAADLRRRTADLQLVVVVCVVTLVARIPFFLWWYLRGHSVSSAVFDEVHAIIYILLEVIPAITIVASLHRRAYRMAHAGPLSVSLIRASGS